MIGDDRQTRIREPDEVMYIGGRIDLDNLGTHELLVNFRNPPQTVALLNRLYGYQMRAAKKDVNNAIQFVQTTDIKPETKPT